MLIALGVIGPLLLIACQRGSSGSPSVGSFFHTGKIAVETKPRGARIFINEKYVGISPLSVYKEAGDYLIRAKKKGYEDQTAWATVTKDHTSSIKLTFTK